MVGIEDMHPNIRDAAQSGSNSLIPVYKELFPIDKCADTCSDMGYNMSSINIGLPCSDYRASPYIECCKPTGF